jgi:hypothetical protein
MRAMTASKLALGLCLFVVGGGLLAFQESVSFPQGTQTSSSDVENVVLDYSGLMNCESDLWNNESYLDNVQDKSREPTTKPSSESPYRWLADLPPSLWPERR